MFKTPPPPPPRSAAPGLLKYTLNQGVWGPGKKWNGCTMLYSLGWLLVVAGALH